MNFTGDRRSVLTLAHELGHGLHGYLAQPLGLFNADTPLTTAETASVFGEALTFKRLLALEEDPRRRLNLLAGRIEDSIATVFRQIAMNRFEDARAHRRGATRASSRPRSSRSSGSTRSSGSSATRSTSTGYGTWWSYIPHFIGTPGYVYAYSYGFLFALSIFRKYELEGDAMVEPYLDVLRAGGSKPPEELARDRRPRPHGSRASGRAGSTRSPWSSTRPRRSRPRSVSASRRSRRRRGAPPRSPAGARRRRACRGRVVEEERLREAHDRVGEGRRLDREDEAAGPDLVLDEAGDLRDHPRLHDAAARGDDPQRVALLLEEACGAPGRLRARG